MENYDVVIVGAGPAGLNCAQKLAEGEKKVLLLEQNEIIGPKVCAGGLTSHVSEYFKFPDSLFDIKFKQITVHTPHTEEVLKFKKEILYTVERKKLGQWQLKHLEKTSAVIKTNSRVTGIGKNHIVINDTKKVRFKQLVGADGSASMVREYTGLKTSDVGIAIQYLIPTKKFRHVEFFYDSSLFHSWYAWIFPHKHYVSVGAGCDPRYLSSKKLRAGFDKWLKERNIDVSEGEYQSHPINFDYQGFKSRGVFLIGDAAGLASGLTGEGIFQALISGEEIAKMIIDNKYVSEKLKEFIETKSLHNRILHFFEKSGPIRKVEYELLGILLKSKLIGKSYVELLT